MREDDIDRDQVLALLDEDLSKRSQGLMKIIEKNGAKQIAEYLTQF